MFTDMAEYTSLTQKDEAQALKVLKTHNRLLRPIFARYHGREIKTMGDAFLVEFGSALEATNCAIEMQRTLDEHNHQAKERILIRIGIHVGDVVHKGGDLYGDAINIASRIEPLADAGDICISEQVYDQVRNKIPFPFAKVESRDLKHITFPMEVYKVQLPWMRRKAKPGIPTISVAEARPPRGKAYERETIGEIIEKMAMKDRIIVVKLTNDPSIPALLARFSEVVDYGRGETFHIVSAGERITVVIDSKNLEKLTRVMPRKNILGIYRDLAEIIISLSEKLIFKPGGVSTISGELATNGINIFEFFTSTPTGIIIVSEKDALRSYQLLQKLASSRLRNRSPS